MAKFANQFTVSGIVAMDADVRSFASASVARFPLCIRQSRLVNGEQKVTSALISIEAWRKNENSSVFSLMKKGTKVTIEGYFKPEEWMDGETKRNRVILTCTKIEETEDEQSTPASENEN